jgi:outer membrane protein
VEQARRIAQQSVTRAWSQLLAARANIGSTDVQVRAARIAAEGVRQEQQVGLRTTIDVLNAEQELRAAELAQISARRDEYVASAAVLSAVGRLDAANLAPELTPYDPQANGRSLRYTWGWTPWEEPIGLVDSVFVPQATELDRSAPVSPVSTAQ